VLGVEHIGIDDNLFDLGGNSMLVAKIVAHMRKKTAPNVGIIDLFQYPKIRALAERLEAGAPEVTPDEQAGTLRARAEKQKRAMTNVLVARAAAAGQKAGRAI
jgi:hypothetical protein